MKTTGYIVEEHAADGILVTHFATKKAAREFGMDLRRQGRDAYMFEANSPWRSSK